jgi:hypothetical protein
MAFAIPLLSGALFVCVPIDTNRRGFYFYESGLGFDNLAQ